MSIRSRVPWVAVCLLAVTMRATGAVDESVVRRALARGVNYLKQSQNSEGLWTRQTGTMGATALAALALLECGVQADDPIVQKAAEALRDGSIPLTDTYSISLCIMFFDRLGDAGDTPLLKSLTERLLAGQTDDGGWTYECPSPSGIEVNRLRTLVMERSGKNQQNRSAQNAATPTERPKQAATVATTSDNSNTQFATLALWIGHRHGLPVAQALARLEARFRNTQNADGGWGYNPGTASPATSPAMICAGLLGLSVAYGYVNEAILGGRKGQSSDEKPNPKGRTPRDPGRDQAIRAGLVALAALIGQPSAPRQPRTGAVQTGNFPNYYFLWSLERVAMVFGLQTIGNKDWYGWGAEFALARQEHDGSWNGGYAEGGVDTSFALLFLQRSNLVRDLTTSLRGSVQDPGEAAMRSGGLGSQLAKGEAGSAAKTGESLIPKLLPPSRAAEKAVTDPEAARLSSELLQAAPVQRGALLEKLREGKGAVHTQALAAAIPQLTGLIKTRARDALAERLSRMTAETLEDKLQDSDLEIRRAAALACAMKEEKEFIPKLLSLLEDPEPLVVRAAHAALKALTAQDFGPSPEASRAEHAKAIAAWKSWWLKQGGSVSSGSGASAALLLEDKEKLQGAWLLTALERDGRTLPMLGNLQIKLVFRGDNVTFEYPDHTEVGTYRLQVGSNPKTIDVLAELDTSRGIYRLEGDSLVICGVPAGQERPAEFATKPGTKQILYRLKRQKP